MQRNFVSAAALVLAAAALLTACDKTKAPSPSTADVAALVPAAQPEKPEAVPSAKAEQPAATAQIEYASPHSAQQVRVPYVAKDGEARLASLKNMEGKYRWDGVDYLKTGVLAERLKALTGKHYETVLKNLETVGPLEMQENMLTVFGNRQRMGGEEAAGVVIDPARNGLRIWLLTDGKQIVFTDVDGADIQWPKDMQALIANQLPAS